MFAAPSVRDFVDTGDTIDLMQRYVLLLQTVTDEGVSSFAKDRNDPLADHSIKWVWNVYGPDNVAILNSDGTVWDLWEWTGNRTGHKQDGTPSKARERLEALVGRELADDEIIKVPIDKLPGRKVYGLFHRVKQKQEDGTERLKLKILKVAPYKDVPSMAEQRVAADAEAAAQAKARANKPMPEAMAIGAADSNELPF